jgi:integrase
LTLARINPSNTFAEASALWLSSRTLEPSPGPSRGRFIRATTEKSYAAYIDSLNLFFANLRLARTIPLISAEVKWSLEQLVARAKDLGANSPLDFLFPFRRPPAAFDPTRPMTVSGIKRPWNEVRQASGLKWFRPYDTRHTAITRWAENGKHIADIMVMAGHMSPRTTAHYTHISEQARQRALREVAARIGLKSEGSDYQPAPFYVQNHRA